MKKVVAIVGPTGVGKTKLSIELAKVFNAEIISGDSVQVYKHANIGSAKILETEKEGIVHHLIDILEPLEPYSVAEYQKKARELIQSIDTPFIVGGTGLYIQAVIGNYEFSQERDEAFERLFEAMDNETLYHKLRELDPVSAEKYHTNNRRRILRALQIIHETNQPMSKKNKKSELQYDALVLYLHLERSVLRERIAKRVEQMFQDGLEAEAKWLYDNQKLLNAIGYKEWVPYFEGQVDIMTVKEAIIHNTRRLAKRQETWFRNQMPTTFISVDLDDFSKTIEEAKSHIIAFYEE